MQDLLKLMRTNSSVLAEPSRLEVPIPTDGESRHLSCAKLNFNPFLRLTDLTTRGCGRIFPLFCLRAPRLLEHDRLKNIILENRFDVVLTSRFGVRFDARI